MILLKILAFLLLLPVLLLFLISLILYVSNLAYYVSVVLCILALSSLTDLMTSSYVVALSFLVTTTIIWAFKISALKNKEHMKKEKDLIFLNAFFKKEAKDFSISCKIPFSILKLIQKIPTISKCNISKDTSNSITINELINIVILSCKGSFIKIKTNECELNLTIN